MSVGPRVALDASPAAMGSTGVARYVRQLADALASDGADVVPFAYGRGSHPVPAGTVRATAPYRAVALRWRLTGRPRVESLVGRIDVVHATDLVPPPTRAPVVVTVHDLLALDQPELHGADQRARQQRQLAAARRAEVVLAVSAVTERALRRHGVTGTVVVAPLAASPSPAAVDAPVAGRYLLAVGELATRKDLPTLVRAFLAAELAPDVRLVLVGPDGHGAAAAHRAAEAAGGDRVLRLGRVTEPDLMALYRDAIALCSPSLAEGFNLPLVEAMAAGTAVVASDLPITAEVAGDAALTAPPGDVDAWAAALAGVTADDALRTALVVRGRARASTYSWRRTARATRAAYAQAVA